MPPPNPFSGILFKIFTANNSHTGMKAIDGNGPEFIFGVGKIYLLGTFASLLFSKDRLCEREKWV
jgi:hypothetical protein